MTNRFKVILLGILVGIVVLLANPAAANPSKQSIQSSIVKVMATHNHPDYQSPWQRKGINSVTGSGVIIGQQRILTNAHVVADQTLVEVQREGYGNTYTADVEFVCHSCDLAILTIDDESFFKDAVALEIDGLPELQSRVAVYGFPTGGETISITEGIVSRIEVDYYVHSSDRYLLAQVDAAINPGNSGGPVISNGKIVGIAMQALEQAENIGYIVPAPVINHFLDDVKDGQFDGFPELDIYVQLLENKALRQSLNLPKNSGGLLVTGVDEQSHLAEMINPGDVILKIDQYDIGRDGKVTLESGLRVESTHLEYLKQVGSSLQLKLFRDGKTFTQKVPLTPRKKRMNQKEYDIDPTYFVFAGMVFQPLSNGYLTAHHNAQYFMLSYIPEYTMQGYRKLIPDRIKSDRDQVVVLSRVLPDAINQGYKSMEHSVVNSINGTTVKNMAHLIKLIESVDGPYLNIITDFGNLITLDINKARHRHETILKKYQVYVDRSQDLR
ncbi:MAG: trypsin-like peptidase domain-containing protein [Gammaproteobacteria bacterium]|nr:trypsin-like peptidase domain-containing protein [Gammaproteobacteria bacterium]